MKLKVLIFSALAIGALGLAYAQGECHPIETTDSRKGYPITAQSITRPGEYCLRHDIRAPRVYVLSEGGERSFLDFMLTIDASDVVLDLHGFAMNVDTRGMGGVKLGYEKPDARHIVVRNGTIKSRSRSVIVFGIPKGSLLSDFKAIYESPQTKGMAERQFQRTLNDLPSMVVNYANTQFLIEHMEIGADTIADGAACVSCVAIGMKGAGNVIRNSTIEVTDGHTAIYLFGPNQLIENNIIIFKGEAAVESAAAIKLHQADGTIIRNNDIIIESSGDEAPKAAISLIDSKNVVAENNRIYGIGKLMHAWDDKSSLIDRDNDFRSMLRRPWPSDKPGVQ